MLAREIGKVVLDTIWVYKNASTTTELLAEVDRLKAENARLREDAKRLDFLEDCQSVCLTRVRESECAGTYIDYLIGSCTGEAKRLRQAIDAAMEPKSK